MNLKQAQYLEAICKTGSITAAAAELYVSRTVISHCLRDLENEFDASLFTRTRTGIKLTEAGEILRESCRQMKASYTIAKDKIDALTCKMPQARLNIAVTTTTGLRLFPEFFTLFGEQCPDITYTISEMSAYDTIESIQEGVIDFAVTPVSFQSDDYFDIDKLFLHKLSSVIYMSKNDPLSKEPFLTKAQIAKRAFVTPATPNPLPYPVNITMRVNSLDLIHNIVASGLAITVLPTDFTKGWDDIACVPLETPLISSVHIIWNKALPHSSAFHRFLSFAKKYDISKLENY